MAWQVNYTREMSRRLNLIRLIGTDKSLVKHARALYAKDPIAFIEDLCVTVDPRQEIKVLPFVLFPKQKEFIRYLQGCLKEKANGLCEKCRDMGATWLCCAFAVWVWLFIKDSSIGFGSALERKVDKLGDMDSILEKVRTIIRYLPWWIMPEGFEERRHMPKMRIFNPENKAMIKGDSGEEIGRGGRSLMYFKDESAHYEHPEKIEAALSMNTDIQIDISSVNGQNLFYNKRMDGILWEETRTETYPRGKTRVFVFDWRDDPRKDQEWYDTTRQRFEGMGLLHIFAQEVDRDYFSSVTCILIKREWIDACVDSHVILKFKPKGQKISAQDIADGGGDRNANIIREGILAYLADQWGGEAGEAAKKIIPVCVREGVRVLYYDSIGVGAGFRVQTKTMITQGSCPKNLRIEPWDASGAVVKPEERLIPGDQLSPKNEDHFLNMKAQGWWALRTRVYRTFMAVRNGELPKDTAGNFDPDQLISLSSKMPYLQQLLMEVCQPTYDYNQAGKMLVDKKPDEAKSPNLADALMMCYFAPHRLNTIFNFQGN